MSDRHLAALNASLRAAHNHSTQVRRATPTNPVYFVRRSSPDVLLSPTDRARERAATSDRELREAVAGKSRPDAAAARTRAAVSGRDARVADFGDPDDEEGDYGEPQSRSMSKSHAKGAFQRLRNQVNNHYAEHGTGASMQSEEFDQRALMAELKGTPIMKTDTSSLRKSMAKVANALGNATLAKSLEAGYSTNDAKLTGGSAVRKQSLAGTKQVPKQRIYTSHELLKAASAALHAGAITADEAHRINTQIAFRGGVSSEMLAKLTGSKPAAARTALLTKSQCVEALSKSLAAGQITGAQAMAAEACLNRDVRVADDTMAVLCQVHFGK